MIKGRASPVAITYRPNSNAMYPQNKVSTKYITNPIKYTISNHDFKITPKQYNKLSINNIIYINP